MELSYTQNLEDYHLSLAFAGQASGTYIDVGAGHPVADNVSFWFYERGWRGIVIEPQADLAGLYARLRPRDTAVCGLIGRQDGDIDFHVVDRLHGFSTTVEHVAQEAKKFGVGYRTIRMPVVTLARLCEAHHVNEIDFLKIDVEGG
jgi:FkbM family methyltransferase